MSEEVKTDLKKDVQNLYQEKNTLVEEIRRLDGEKIERLENANQELEKRYEWQDKERIKLIKERDNYRKQVKGFRGKKWSNAFRMVMALVVLDIIILPLLIWAFRIPAQWMFIGLGTITFFGILLISSYLSGTSPLNTGEIRKAITGSFVIIYFAFMPLVAFGSVNLPADEPIKTIITHFTWIVGAIVIFYFISRTVEEYVKAKNQ
ncbi:MAG TPA: hypothetical protein PL055_03925 [Methanobacterium sp.]|nr:MAG: hypothetical protein FGO69_05280 [Methanobacterium sp.]HOI71188.1 hypothetical protein [Methanobacterium sp.]HPX77892.1 hypothetical protein [Methanobacterium sp.]